MIRAAPDLLRHCLVADTNLTSDTTSNMRPPLQLKLLSKWLNFAGAKIKDGGTQNNHRHRV